MNDSRRGARAAWLLVCAAALGGCASGPDYQPPALDLPPAFKEAPADAAAWRPARPRDGEARGPWWRAYGDTVLDGLVERALDANVSIAQAEAQLRGARALVDTARAGAWPTLGVNAGATRGRSTASRSGGATVAGGTSTLYTASLAASWEPDLWGRVRRGVEQAQGNAQASADDLENARLAVATAVVQDYVALRLADAQQALLGALVDDAARALQLTRDRVAAGVASDADVAQAQAQLEGTRAQAIDVQSQRAASEHALAVLVGEAPARFSITPAADPGALALALPPVAPGLPAALLERRPDVAGAERRLAAANAGIGVAQAAWFPSITLGASLGSEAGALSKLFSAPAAVWSLGPALAATLFDGGARRAQTEQARAAYDAALATYRGDVLGAMQEVEDALASLRVLADEAVVEQRAVDAAQRSLSLVTSQYRAGTVGYADVVGARSTAITAQRTLLALQGSRLQASVQLVKALGGAAS